MQAYPKREAWDIVCEKKANQAYLDPAFVQPIFIMLEGFRLSSLRSSKLDSKSADIESEEVHTQWRVSKAPNWQYVRNPIGPTSDWDHCHSTNSMSFMDL